MRIQVLDFTITVPVRITNIGIEVPNQMQTKITELVIPFESSKFDFHLGIIQFLVSTDSNLA
jgi:hypothetical protein